MNTKMIFGLLYGNIVLYAFCFMMQQPVLPDLIKRYVTEGSAEVEWAKLQTTFAFVQMVGVLTAGYISDIMGAKTVLVLSQVASAAGYGLQWHTDSLTGLYLSRVPSVFQHAFMGTSAYITDLTPPDTRSQMLGYIQLAYGVGMVAGPLTGGYFSSYDLSLCSLTATVVSCFQLLLVLLLPNTKAEMKKTTKPDHSFAECLRVLTVPAVMRVAVVKCFAALALSVWQSMFVVGAEGFGFGAKGRSFVMVYMSVVGMMLVGGGMIKRLEGLFETMELNVLTGCLLAACYVLVPLCTKVEGTITLLFEISVPMSVCTLVVLLVPIVAGTSILRTTIPSLFTRSVDNSKSGLVLGVDMALSSMAGLVAPTLGTAAFTYFGFEGLGSMCGALIMMMAAVSYTMLKKTKQE